MSNYKATRRTVYFGERQSDESKEIRRIKRLADSHSTSSARIAEQQHCKDYWARMYGVEAEVKSRGGVSWLR